MIVRTIPLALIDVGTRLRALDPVWVDALAEEILRDGQSEPISVASRGDRFALVAGARVFAAHLKLGRTEIEAKIGTEEAFKDDAALRLAEIKSNLMRGELTVLERAIYVAAWRSIYQSAQTPPKRGRKPKDISPAANDDELSANFALNFSDAAQRALKISRRSVFLALKVASINRALAHRLTGCPIADNQSELLYLAEQEPKRQAAIVDLLVGDPPDATTVAEAIARIDGAPAALKPSPYERIHQNFARLPETQQHAFFELNAEAIERWQAARAGNAARKLRRAA